MTTNRNIHRALMSVIACAALTAVSCLEGPPETPITLEPNEASPASGFDRLEDKPIPPRRGHTVTTLPDGRVLVFGGLGPNDALVGESEWFDPATGEYAHAPEVAIEARAFHTATITTDGGLLIAGGEDRNGTPLATALRVDTTTFQVVTLPNRLVTARRGHSARLLKDGRVAFWGGDGSPDIAPPSVELFDDRSRTFAATDGRALLLGSDEATPEVVGSFPTDGDENAPLVETIGVRLSRPIDPASVRPESVTLIGHHGALDVTAVLAEGGKLLFIRPPRMLLPATYYIVVLRDLRDLEGGFLSESMIGFKTRAIAASESVIDTRLPRPPRFGARASAVPLADYTLRFEREKNGQVRFRPVSRSFIEDEEDWLPGPENLRGYWHRPLPEVREIEPLVAPEGITALSGRVLRITGKPLASVRMAVDGHETVTDAEGRFLLEGLPAGARELEIDGSDAGERGAKYGLYYLRVHLTEGMTLELPHVIWMTRLDPRGTVSIPSPITETTVISSPSIPGFELRLTPGTVVRDRSGRILTEINLTAIPANQPPFPVADIGTPTYYTFQPGGAMLEGLTADFRGGELVYPNYRGAFAGARINFWHYDPRGREWHSYGYGTVTPDRTQIVADSNVAIYELVGTSVTTTWTPPTDQGPDPYPEHETDDTCGDDCSEVNPGAGVPGSSTGGDPVMLASGQYTRKATDLVVNDVIPIVVDRYYRSQDRNIRNFGFGMVSGYDYFLLSTTQCESMILIEPRGTRVHFTRTSGGSGCTRAVLESRQKGWVGTELEQIPSLGWEMRFRDGRRWYFKDSMAVSLIDWAAPLAEMRDRAGNALRITRSGWPAHNIQRIDSPNGRWVEFELKYYSITGTFGQPLKATDSLGRTVTYAYNDQGRLTSVTDAEGRTRKYEWDAYTFLLSAVKLADGTALLRNEYTDKRVTRQVLADGSTFTYDYLLHENCGWNDWLEPGQGRQPGVLTRAAESLPPDPCRVEERVAQVDITDRFGNVRRVFMDHYGLVQRDVYRPGHPDEEVTEQEWDGLELTAVIDPHGRRTEYAYDDKGMRTKTTLWAGTAGALTTTVSYTDDGQLASMTLPTGETTQYTYDSRRNMTRVKNALGHETVFEYEASDRVSKIVDALGSETWFEYDKGDLVAVIDPEGRETRYVYDAAGRLMGKRTPGGSLTRFERDGNDRIVAVTNAMGHVTAFEYNAMGNIVKHTDPRGAVTRYAYSPMGQMTARTDPLNRTERFAYEAGRIKSFMDRKGQLTGYAYDPQGRWIREGFGATERNPTNYASTILYTFDNERRLTRAEDSRGSKIDYTYDALGRRESETTPSGTIRYEYDRHGRVRTMMATGQADTVYDYDRLGRLVSMTKDSREVRFQYDALGRRVGIQYPSGMLARYRYSEGGRLLEIVYTKGDQFVENITYEYDLDGNRIAVGGTLAKLIVPESRGWMDYDAAGQLVRRGAATLQYDANGNVIHDGVQQYVWNERNELQEIRQGPTQVARFEYLPDGRRIGKTVSGRTTRYMYDGPNIIQEQSVTGAVQATLMVGREMDVVHERTTSEGSSDFLVDALWTIMGLHGETTERQTRLAYTPYGEATVVSGSIDTNTQTYTAREEDGTGLMYYRARYYDPELGRFIGEEPYYRDPWTIGAYALEGYVLGSYTYALNNPLTFVDPNGLKPGDRFSGKYAQNRAAADALDYINPWSKRFNIEFAGLICQENGSGAYFANRPRTDFKKDTCSIKDPCPFGSTPTAAYHTHAAYSADPDVVNEVFSPMDFDKLNEIQLDGYLGTPGGKYLKYDYGTGRVVVLWPM